MQACSRHPCIALQAFCIGFDIRNKKYILIIINCNPEWMPGSKLVVGTYLYYYYLASKITSSKFKPYKEQQNFLKKLLSRTNVKCEEHETVQYVRLHRAP